MVLRVGVGGHPGTVPPSRQIPTKFACFAVGSLSSHEIAHETRRPNITNSCPAPSGRELFEFRGGPPGGVLFGSPMRGGVLPPWLVDGGYPGRCDRPRPSVLRARSRSNVRAALKHQGRRQIHLLTALDNERRRGLDLRPFGTALGMGVNGSGGWKDRLLRSSRSPYLLRTPCNASMMRG